MKSSDIRQKFLNYFKAQSHEIIASASLIPSDPTVLLTLAGMLPFKPYFLGLKKPPFSRAASIQKCVRTNDIENVGRTARHHTFFEMMGNFSFGDYFKKDAIAFAWEFLTRHLNLDPQRLMIAVFEKDDETFDLWKKVIGVPTERIFRLGEDNNFWAAGETGPCGPCSEIYFDQGPAFGCGKPQCSPGCDCDRFLEIWNLVFIEFNRDAKGKLNPLPQKNIDTGMGLERISAVMQQAPSNFDTDLFLPLIQKIKKQAKSKNLAVAPLRIVADHARAITYLLADGLIPANERRGYILRRLMRRAVLNAYFLGLPKNSLWNLAQEVIEMGQDFYPELIKNKTNIEHHIKNEEKDFSLVLEDGLKILEDFLQGLKKGERLSGEKVFKLHDTFGFPFDMTREIAEARGFSVDLKGFESLMQQQKERARVAGLSSGKIKSKIASLDVSSLKPTVFEGYIKLSLETKIVEIFPEDNLVVLEKTPFYPESGGQMGDTGILEFEGKSIHVLNALGAIQGIIFHEVDHLVGLHKGQKIKALVDSSKRQMICINHSATHLLQAALRNVLGDSVRQAGSFVASDRLRFDFSFGQPLTEEQLSKVEVLVNKKIQEKIKSQIVQKSRSDAEKMGAMALFGEKYSDKVRVVKLGDFSMELCGGCHIKNTGEIGFFKIISEQAIAKGTRRIEALCGDSARLYLVYRAKQLRDRVNEDIRENRRLQAQKESLGSSAIADSDIFEIEGTELDNISRAIDRGDSPSVNKFIDHLGGRADWIKERNRKLVKEIDGLKLQKALKEKETLLKEFETIGAAKVLVKEIDGYSAHVLKDLAQELEKSQPDSIVVFGVASAVLKKANIIILLSESLAKKGLNAGKLVRLGAEIISGRGGGRPTLAEAGGEDFEKLLLALSKIKEEINQVLKS